jgi:hypothetical protein
MPRSYRTGKITLEQAKEKFHEYYDKRGKTNIGRLRAKLNDMKYQKKSKFTLKPNEPGSIKYLLEEGPRTFDMEGVDWFPEGTEFEFNAIGYDKPIKGISLGATKDKTNVDKLEDGTNDEAYGPKVKRIKGEKQLYKKYFKKKYKDWVDKKGKKNIIDIYWEKYSKNPSEFKRKNKKSKVSLKDKIKLLQQTKTELEVVKFVYDNKDYFINYNLDIFDNNMDKPELIGNLNDIDEDLKNYLVDKGIVILIGSKYLLLDSDTSKFYYFKISETEDDKIYKINSLNEVYDMNDTLVAQSLNLFLNIYNIYNFDLELVNENDIKKNSIKTIKPDDEKSSSSESDSESDDEDITKLLKDIKLARNSSISLSKTDKDNIVNKLSSKGYKKIRGSPIKSIVDKLN